MRSLILFIFLTLFTSTSFATPCESNGVLCETLKRRSAENYPRKICVLSSEGFEPVWYLLFDGGLPQRLDKIPDSMMSVYHIRVSPSQQFMAITSAGEGHPLINVVELSSLLQQQSPQTLVELNPYPGSINFIRWESKASVERLIVESDRLLTEQNQDVYSWQKFAIELPSGKKTALSSELQQLIPYYVKLLRKPENSADEIIEILVSLATTDDRKLLLQQAFDRETQVTVKATLAKVLERVKLSLLK